MAFITFQPNDHFNTKLWTGTGSENAITGIGFQPDFTWIKNRAAAENHKLYDAVRGVTKNIYSNLTNAEGTDAQSLKSFDSDGFTLGTESALNANGQNIVGWNLKANGAGSANTDGSTNTTSTSANTTAGISIMKYGGTGSSATIGHGLGATPKVLFFKQLDGTESWRMWHRNAPNYSTKALALNLSSAEFSQSNWVGTVNNSTIALGADGSINLNAKNYICYAFAEKKGFSKIGSWTGNGNADGSFIYTGFKPAFIISKNADRNENWLIHDNKRGPINVNQNRINPNDSGVESSASYFNLDFLSNGFKIRSTDTALNQSGEVYVFMAFAAEPLVASNSTPATAR